MNKKRQSPMTPTDRRRHILAVALRLAGLGNYRELKRSSIAQAAGVAVGTVSHACGTMRALRADVMALAIETEHLGVLAQGLASRDPIALNAPDDLKNEAVRQMI